MLKQFYMGIPKELDKAAYIDGAGYLRIYVSVILPLSKSALVVVGIFSFLRLWNDSFTPLIYLQEYKNFTIALGLQSFQLMAITDGGSNHRCATSNPCLPFRI